MSAKSKRSVQDQVASRKLAIIATARQWIDAPIMGIEKLLQAKGLSFPNGLVVELYAYPACCDNTYEGVVVSHDGRFFGFVAELSRDETDLLTLEEWKEITNETEICNHKRGIGWTFGALALEVRNEILSSSASNG